MDSNSYAYFGIGPAIASLFGIWMAYSVLIALYNVSPFHPLHKFPGPKLAAATYWYEAYYDWIMQGRYTKVINKMHEQYRSRIVRISPDELHCNDPYFTDEIYASGRVRDKWQHNLNTSSTGPLTVSGFSTVPHELHRARRGAVSRFFSRQQVSKLEGEIRGLAQLVINKILEHSGKEAFNVREAFNCYTADVISQYAFGEPMGFVAQEGWEPNFATWVKSFVNSAYTLRHNAILRYLATGLPLLANYMGDDIKNIMNQMDVVIPKYVEAAGRDPDNGRIFAELQQDKQLPPEEKTTYRLTGEGFAFMVAGTETTAAVLTVIAYHLFDKPATSARVRESLQGLNPSEFQWTDLERKPYLWAFVHEALRMMPGVSHRSARIAREEDLFYKNREGTLEWVVPRGTPIGMTSMINHFNEELFPNADKFDPERWLIDGQPNYKLQKFLIAFSKGSRVCLGEFLALCEIYHMMALLALIIAPRAQLSDTTIEDISYDHDMVVVQTKKGTIAVRIKID